MNNHLLVIYMQKGNLVFMSKIKKIIILLTLVSLTSLTNIQTPIFAIEDDKFFEPENNIALEEETNNKNDQTDEAINVKDNTEETLNLVLKGDAAKVNYFYVGSPYLETPDESEFVVSFGDGSEDVSRMNLIIEGHGDSIIEIENINRVGQLFHFKRLFTDEESGVYKVTEIRYFIDNQEYQIILSDLGIDALFGVNEEYDGYVATYSNETNLDMSDVEGSIVSLNPDNMENSETLIEEKIKEISSKTPSSLSSLSIDNNFDNKESKVFVIALDPGHGGSDPGSTTYYGISEATLNLKIANYCKQELETYKNVRVVMTRTGDTSMGLEERVTYAVSQGANVFISIHLNALNGVGRGAEVYYPNSNYRPELGTEGEILAQQVLNQLVALGIPNRGIHIRNIDDGDDPKYDYPDGSRGDYYGVIRHAKKQGIAGIIIEHCFGDNYTDYNAYLNSEDKLKRLGLADANGIAQAYNLQKISRDEIDAFAQSNKDAIKDGVYEIQSNLNNDYVLDIKNGSAYNGANVQIYESNDSTAQFWQISHDSIGYVTIKNLNTNTVLDVDAGKANNGSNVQAYSSNGSYAQKWIIEKNEDGYVIYSALNPIYCLDVSGGNATNESNVQLYISNKTDAQKWQFTTPDFYESFLDVTLQNWFHDSVKYVYENSLMTGLNETTFGPYENLARAQFAVILHRMNGQPSIEYTNKFPDVVAGQWYTDAILWANDIGVVTGYSNTGLFGTGDQINREQMAVMMYRYAQYKGYDTSASADFSKFNDAVYVNDFAKDAMSWAVGTGIITGKDNETRLDPLGSATRAECATIIMRFMEYYK